MELVKREVFRRAGEATGAMGRFSSNAVVHAVSPILRMHHAGTDRVTCSGSIALDLPPGFQTVDARQTLQSKVSYELEPGATGLARLVGLSNTEAIVGPLATVSERGSRTAASILPAPPTEELRQGPATGSAATTASSKRPQLPPAVSTAPSPAVTLAPPRPLSRPSAQIAVAAPPVLPQAPQAAPPASTRPAPPTAGSPLSSIVRHVSPQTPSKIPLPSFNCRSARASGAIAVCNDPMLASLDEETSAQFSRARSIARPGQRVMLERTHRLFLRYRDSCRSESCVADAYRRRMQEISGIMKGPW
jgi:hypothetical protein